MKCATHFFLCAALLMGHYPLLIISPTESEILDADKKLKRLMEEWRKQKLSLTLKAHIFEHHAISKMRELQGMGDKDESFVELLHQDGARHERRLNNVPSYKAKHNSILKNTTIGALQEVARKKADHYNAVKRSRNQSPDAVKGATGISKQDSVRKESKNERTTKRDRFLVGDTTLQSLDSHNKTKK
jgi:hypothetical protein